MNDVLEKRKYLYKMSGGKHVCCTCIHATEVDGNSFLMTTMDFNSCNVMTMAEEDGNYKKNLETVDNGGGYWITKCKFYEYDENWNKVKYYDYIKSDKWKAKRLEAQKRDGYQCKMCGTAINLVVHHITYDRLGNEDLADLVTLCKNCHKRIHEHDLMDRV